MKSAIPIASEHANGFPSDETHSRICKARILHFSGYLITGGGQSMAIPLIAVFIALLGVVAL